MHKKSYHSKITLLISNLLKTREYCLPLLVTRNQHRCCSPRLRCILLEPSTVLYSSSPFSSLFLSHFLPFFPFPIRLTQTNKWSQPQSNWYITNTHWPSHVTCHSAHIEPKTSTVMAHNYLYVTECVNNVTFHYFGIIQVTRVIKQGSRKSRIFFFCFS